MRRRCTLILPLVLLSAVCAAAGTIGQIDFDPSALPAAFPGAREASDAALTSELRRRLPMDMSVVASQRIIVAAPAPEQETRVTGRRIAGYETQIRRRHFPDVAARRIVVVLGGDESNVRGLAKALYPAVDVARVPDPGFYHSEDGLILAKASDGDRAVLNGLMRALVQDDNPNAPHWFIEAMATLFESIERSADGLVPTLDERMALIATDEDLDYDVFAGICDCSALTAEQRALIRLLLVYLVERDRLAELRAAVRQQGRYTTLLQALDAMALDRQAWKTFAEQRVRAYWKSGGGAS